MYVLFSASEKKQVFWIDITAICQMDMCSARAGHFVQSLIIINMFGLGMKQARGLCLEGHKHTDRESENDTDLQYGARGEI